MSEILENINTDTPVINTDSKPDKKEDDIDAEIDRVLAMKPKSKRKPLSEEAKQKKRDILAESRKIRVANVKNKHETEKKFKEKVNIIENLDEVIEKKIKDKIPEKPVKLKKDKTEKLQKKKELIESIVEEKIKGFKKAKEPESDFKLIQRFF
jgi:hypothetical protein